MFELQCFSRRFITESSGKWCICLIEFGHIEGTLCAHYFFSDSIVFTTGQGHDEGILALFYILHESFSNVHLAASLKISSTSKMKMPQVHLWFLFFCAYPLPLHHQQIKQRQVIERSTLPGDDWADEGPWRDGDGDWRMEEEELMVKKVYEVMKRVDVLDVSVGRSFKIVLLKRERKSGYRLKTHITDGCLVSKIRSLYDYEIDLRLQGVLMGRNVLHLSKFNVLFVRLKVWKLCLLSSSFNLLPNRFVVLFKSTQFN